MKWFDLARFGDAAIWFDDLFNSRDLIWRCFEKNLRAHQNCSELFANVCNRHMCKMLHERGHRNQNARDSKADMEPFSLRGYRILSTEILTWFITFEIWTRVEREIWTITSKQIVSALTQHNNVIASLYWGSWTLPNRFTLQSARLFLIGNTWRSRNRHLRRAARIRKGAQDVIESWPEANETMPYTTSQPQNL